MDVIYAVNIDGFFMFTGQWKQNDEANDPDGSI